jgi:4-amino-4-deoxy-L-arabinose transferase-like glycosyltransferase
MLVTPFPVLAGVACISDPFLLATATLFHHSVVRRLRDGSRTAMDVAALALALGFLAKGHMILLFTVVPMALAWTGVMRELARPRRLLLLAAGAAWFVAIELRCPGFFEEQALAFAARASGEGHNAPFYVYVAALAAGLLPFAFYAPWGLAPLFPHAPSLLARIRHAPAESRLVVLWLALPLLVFSAVGSRLWTYILPSVPPLAVLAAACLADMRRARTTALSAIAAACGAAVLVARLAGVRAGEPFLATVGVGLLLIGAWLLLARRLPRFLASAGVSALLVATVVAAAVSHESTFKIHRTFAKAVAELSRASGAPVVLAGTVLPSAGFYGDAPVRVAGESNGIIAQEAKRWGGSPRFTPDTDLKELLASDFESVIVVEEKLLRSLAPERVPVLRQGKVVAVFGPKAGTGGTVR